jgi:RHS repeat-associated protein
MPAFDYDPINDDLYFARSTSHVHRPAFDDVGMFYDHPRRFDPAVVAWLSGEPLGCEADANLCRYVSNQPANASDPTTRTAT